MRCASAHVRLRCIGNRCSPYGHCCDTERPKNAATERPTPHVQCFVQRSVSAFRELARRQEPRTMRCGQRTNTTATGHAHSRRRPVKDGRTYPGRPAGGEGTRQGWRPPTHHDGFDDPLRAKAPRRGHATQGSRQEPRRFCTYPLPLGPGNEDRPGPNSVAAAVGAGGLLHTDGAASLTLAGRVK